jgi:hypothetical protein
MTLTKTQIQNLLGVSRQWVNKRIASKPARRQPTHEELVAMVREWKMQEPECQERARWTIDEDDSIRFAWRPDFRVHIFHDVPPRILVGGLPFGTKTIISRFLDGWRIDDMASDYHCDRLAIEAAIAFELKARAT